MKSFFSTVALLFFVLVFTNCNKKTTQQTNVCEGVACTAMFAMINVDLKDSTGSPYTADTTYTIRTDNNDTISVSTTITAGTYTILDDGYVSKMQNKQYTFRFIAVKNGKNMVDELYTISADCCHINKQSGKSTIVVKL